MNVKTTIYDASIDTDVSNDSFFKDVTIEYFGPKLLESEIQNTILSHPEYIIPKKGNIVCKYTNYYYYPAKTEIYYSVMPGDGKDIVFRILIKAGNKLLSDGHKEKITNHANCIIKTYCNDNMCPIGIHINISRDSLKDILTPIVITDLNIQYLGQPVMLYNQYNINDIKVSVKYSDSIYDKVLLPSQYTINLDTITNPNQILKLRYIDDITNEIIEKEFSIPVLYVTDFKVNYTGNYVYIPGFYNVNDIEAFIEFNLPEYNRKLEPNEFTLSDTTVSELGINSYVATENISLQHNLTAQFFVIGLRIVLQLKARYIGPPIEITENINTANVVIELDTIDEEYQNRKIVILKYNPDVLTLPNGDILTQDYTIDSLKVTKVGINTFTAKYIDPTAEYSVTFEVEGIKKLSKFETIYVGENKLLGDPIYNSEVKAYVYYIVDTDGTSIKEELSTDLWTFYDSPILTNANNGYIRTLYNGLFSNIQVEYEIPNTIYLRCWYEGAKIKVGNHYEYKDVIVLVTYPNGDWKELNTYDVIFEDNIVHKKGWNWYKVRYKNSEVDLTGWYAVEGIIENEYPETKFMVRYIDIRNDNREIDYTSAFENKFTIDDIFIISWKKFLEVVNELRLYGLYILTAPKLCGLSNRFDEDWSVLCINNKTLKANITKTYKEEEQWQTELEQRQKKLQNQ